MSGFEEEATGNRHNISVICVKLSGFMSMKRAAKAAIGPLFKNE